MVKSEHIALKADPNDPEDGDVTVEALAAALAEREERRALNKGGRPRGSAKEQVAIRLDKDVLAKFRATGPGWQTRINEVLRRAVIT